MQKKTSLIEMNSNALTIVQGKGEKGMNALGIELWASAAP